MKRLLPVVALLVTLLPACTGGKTNHTDDAAVEIVNGSNENEDKHHEQHPVSLNNGEKWNANAETTEGIKKMTALADGFPEQPKQEDYLSLKASLESEFNIILEKCTMEGEAHEQLHNYLMPLAEMINKLGSADMEVSRLALVELKQQLAAYNNYFQ